MALAALHLLLSHPGVADVAFGIQIAKSFAEQPNLGYRVRKINTARAVRRIGARPERIPEPERMYFRSFPET